MADPDGTTLLTPERMVHGGHALARLDDGRVVLVRGALPAETVRARLESAKGVLRGETVEVLEPSPHRVPSPDHPGLDLGFASYPHQLELKRDVVADALRRARGSGAGGGNGSGAGGSDAGGGAPPVRPSPREWGYRSAVQPVPLREAGRPVGLGYRRPGGHEVVVLEEDPTANAGLRAAWERLRELPPPKGVREVALRGNDDGAALATLVATVPPRLLLDYAHELVRRGLGGVAHAEHDPRGRFRSGSERLAGERTIPQRYGDFEITVSATNFAQPNPGAASELLRAAARGAPAGAHALDLYAGSGVLGFHLAGRFERVTALEIDRGSVERGRRDAEALGLENVRFVRADARRARIEPDVDLVAVDPPRAGLAKGVREEIDASNARTLLYVSCDPATWARDVADLEARGWRLDAFEPFDFQPHTHHVELLSFLSR